MAKFQTDVTFTRRYRRGGQGVRRSLAEALAAPAPAREPEPQPQSENRTPVAPTPSVAGATGPGREAALLLFDEAQLPGLMAAAATEARTACLAEIADRQAGAQAAAAEAIASALAAETERRRARDAADADLILALAETIARHVVPEALRARPLDDLKVALDDLLARLGRPDDLEIAVHPDLVEALGALHGCAGDPPRGRRGCAVVGDAALGPGDARVRWHAGEARHSPDERIADAVARCAGWLAERSARDTPSPTTPEPLDAADGP